MSTIIVAPTLVGTVMNFEKIIVITNTILASLNSEENGIINNDKEYRKSLPIKEFAQQLNLTTIEIERYIEEISNLFGKKGKEAEEVDESLKKDLPHYSRHGFDLKHYKEYMPYTMLALLVEKNGVAEDHAYKLAVVFADDKSSAFKFLRTKAAGTNQTFHDACNSFSLPIEGGWSLKIWRKLAKLHLLNRNFTKVFRNAAKIEENLRNKRETLMSKACDITKNGERGLKKLQAEIAKLNALGDKISKEQASNLTHILEIVNYQHKKTKHQVDIHKIDENIYSLFSEIAGKDERILSLYRFESENKFKKKIRQGNRQIEEAQQKLNYSLGIMKAVALAHWQPILRQKKNELEKDPNYIKVRNQRKALQAQKIQTDAIKQEIEALQKQENEFAKEFIQNTGIVQKTRLWFNNLQEKQQELHKQIQLVKNEQEVETLRLEFKNSIEKEHGKTSSKLIESKDDKAPTSLITIQRIDAFYAEQSKYFKLAYEVARLKHEYHLAKLEFESILKKRLKPKNLEKYLELIKLKSKVKVDFRQVYAKFQQFLSQYEICANTTPAKLLELAYEIQYKNGSMHPKAAELFLSYNIPEDIFEKYLTLKLKQPEEDTLIPEITIDGSEIGYSGFYLKKLDPRDPRAAILGDITGCCQSLGSHGNSCAIHGMTNQYGGFYVLCKGEVKEQCDNDSILAQCWVWRSTNNNLVFDSIETQRVIRKPYEKMINLFFRSLAHYLVTNKFAARVHVGKGGTPENIGFPWIHVDSEHPIIDKDHSDNKLYRDSHQQKLMADSNQPMLYWISIGNDKKIAEYIEQHPGKVAKISNYLFSAIMANNLKILKLILQDICTYCDPKEKKEIFDHIYPIPLLLAVENNLWEMVLILIQAGANFDKTFMNYNGEHIILLIIRASQIEILQYLADNKKEEFKEILQYQSSHDGITLLNKIWLEAFKPGNLVIVKILIEKFGIALHQNYFAWAIRDGDLETIQYLMESGNDLLNGNPNANNYPSLMNAALNIPEVVEYLIKLKADLNALDKDGSTALHVAIRSNRVQNARLLVNAGARVDIKTREGDTPLHFVGSCHEDMLSVAKLLIGKGADPKAKTMNGSTVLHCVAGTKHSLDLVKYLVEEQGVDIYQINNHYRTPYLIAHRYEGNLEVAKYLKIKARSAVERNPKILAQSSSFLLEALEDYNQEGLDRPHPSTPNEQEAFKLERINFLKEVVNQINKIDDRKMRYELLHAGDGKVLFSFARWKEWNIVKYLEQQGFDINYVIQKSDNYDPYTGIKIQKTLLHIAALQNNWDVVRYLIDKNLDRQWNTLFDIEILNILVRNEKLELIKYIFTKCKNIKTLYDFKPEKRDDFDSFDSRIGFLYNVIDQAKINLEVLKCLVGVGFDIYKNDVNGTTALHLAVCRTQHKQARVHWAPSYMGDTVWSDTAFSLNLVKYLVEDLMFDLEAKNSYNDTPLQFAMKCWSNEDIVAYLKKIANQPLREELKVKEEHKVKVETKVKGEAKVKEESKAREGSLIKNEKQIEELRVKERSQQPNQQPAPNSKKLLIYSSKKESPPQFNCFDKRCVIL